MKIRMNLLPYREARRSEVRQKFWTSFAFVSSVGLVVVGAVHMAISGYISNQESRNNYVIAQNKIIDEKIKEISLLRENIDQVKSQQEIIAKLQSDRAAPANLMDQMVRLVPDGMYITKLVQKNNTVNVSGLSQSSDLVSEFMSSIQSSLYLSNPELVEIKAVTTKENRRLQQFSVKFLVRTPSADSKDANTPRSAADELQNFEKGKEAPLPLSAASSAQTKINPTASKAPIPSAKKLTEKN